MISPKYNFVAENTLRSNSPTQEYRVRLTKHGCIVFRGSDIHIYELNKKFIKLYIDTDKRAIGWKLVETEKYSALTELNDTRQIVQNQKTKQASISIRKLLNVLQFDPDKMKESSIELPVEKYKAAYLEDSEIYFITIPRQYETK